MSTRNNRHLSWDRG